jgi:drug/metabolite transporter (DMT)-like permease
MVRLRDDPAVARGLPLALFSVMLWGANGTVVRWLAIRGVSPGVTAFLRVCAAGLVLAVGLRLVGSRWSAHARLLRSPWVWAAMLGYGLNFLVFHAALGRIPAATVMVLENTAPVVAIAGGWILFRERCGWREFAALALAMAGAALVGLDPGTDAGRASVPAGGDALGITLGLASGVTWAAYILACRGLRSRSDEPVAEATASMALMLAGSAVVLAPVAFAPGATWPDNRLDWGVVLALGLTSTAAATVTWRMALDHISAFAASVLYLVTILVSMTVSGLWLGETLSLPKVAGACLVALAVVAVIRRPAAPRSSACPVGSWQSPRHIVGGVAAERNEGPETE